jgi:hypothetical protein
VRVLPYEVLLHGRHVDPVSLQDCIRVLVDSRAGMFSGQGFVPYKHDEPFLAASVTAVACKARRHRSSSVPTSVGPS